MNCFEWNNRASDYLDCTLVGETKKEADSHLDSCEHCQELYRRYRALISQIVALPRSRLPVPIRGEPLSKSLIQKPSFKNRIIRQWKQSSPVLRTAIEGLGIIVIVAGIVSLGPKLRTLYEKGIEGSFYELFENNPFLADQDHSKPNPSEKGQNDGLPANEEAEVHETSDAFQSEGDHEEETTEVADDETNVKAKGSEIWRFAFKSVSAIELRGSIQKTLSESQIPEKSLKFESVPGGFQFDFLIDPALIPDIKTKLQSLVSTAGTPKDLNEPMQPFSWFKSRSKKSLPAGKARVVIWVSQL